MSMEDDLGWEYFGPGDPMDSPRMHEHMDWHNAPENQNQTGNYGERFLLFHKQYVDKFDVFRISKGLLPVSPWDPTTPIPANLSHDHVLVAARVTDNPYAVNPSCKTPTWATVAGGIDADPVYGYTSLTEFQSLDQLGRSIDHGWHGTVHNTIGGDMSQFHSPIDPIFWRWHKWVDQVRATWTAISSLRARISAAAVITILFGGRNDAPGLGLVNGRPVPIPGGPGDPVWRALSAMARDALVGIATHEIAGLMEDERPRMAIQRIALEVVNQSTQPQKALGGA